MYCFLKINLNNGLKNFGNLKQNILMFTPKNVYLNHYMRHILILVNFYSDYQF